MSSGAHNNKVTLLGDAEQEPSGRLWSIGLVWLRLSAVKPMLDGRKRQLVVRLLSGMEDR